MSEEKEVVLGNPVIPPPPIPSKVRMSQVPLQPPPVPRMVDGREVVVPEPEETLSTDEEGEPLLSPEIEKAKGKITIEVYENFPYVVTFEGKVTGSEVDIAWKAMMKEYRVWKHKLLKSESEGE